VLHLPCPNPLPESPTREFVTTSHQSPLTGGEASQRCLHPLTIALRNAANDDVIYDANNGLLHFLEIKSNAKNGKADDDLRTEVAGAVLIPFDATGK
ncbi:hypothetical protein Tco_1560295, partial [Tanacetum coccineum]